MANKYFTTDLYWQTEPLRQTKLSNRFLTALTATKTRQIIIKSKFNNTQNLNVELEAPSNKQEYKEQSCTKSNHDICTKNNLGICTKKKKQSDICTKSNLDILTAAV